MQYKEEPMSRIDRFLARAREVNCSDQECEDIEGKLILAEQAHLGRTITFITEMSEDDFCWFVRKIVRPQQLDDMILVRLCDHFDRRDTLRPVVIFEINSA